jgi:hypothetical protein
MGSKPMFRLFPQAINLVFLAEPKERSDHRERFGLWVVKIIADNVRGISRLIGKETPCPL